MPFGPYEDTEVKDLPVGYIQKLLGKIEIKDRQLKKELEERIELEFLKQKENKDG